MTLCTYLAVASFVLWLVQRCWRRIGPWPAVVLLACPLVLIGPVLATDRVLAPLELTYRTEPLSHHRELLGDERRPPGVLNDVHSQLIPWRAAVRRAWAAGEWPLWNPWMLNGDLLLASAQSAPLSPFSLAELLLPLELSLGFAAALTLFLASLGTFLFLRRLGASRWGSLLAAVAWSWSGFLLFWLQWPMSRCVAFYPWILLAVLQLVRRPGVRPMLALAVLLALLLSSGHPETVLHVVALGVTFAFAALVGRPFRRWPRTLLYSIAGGVLAAALAAASLLPFVDALPESREYTHRSARDPAAQSASAREAAPRLLAQFAPLVFGKQGEETGTAPPSWTLTATAYPGSVVLGLCAIGAFARRARYRGFLIGSLLIGWAAAVSMPPVAPMMHRLPLFSITINERLAFAAAFALAWLLAFGFDTAVRAFRTRAGAIPSLGGVRGRVRRTLVLAVLLATSGFLAAVCRVGSEFADAFGIPPVLQREWSLTLLGASLVPLVVVALRLRAFPAFMVLAVALMAQRRLEAGHYFPSHPREAFYPRVSALAQIPAKAAGRNRVTGLHYALVPNAASVYGLEDPRGYQAMTNGRLVQTMALWSKRQPVWYNRIDSLDAPFLRFLNVRYAIASSRLVAQPGWDVVWNGEGTKLLRSRRAAPRFFVPSVVRLGSSRRKLLAELRRESDFVRRVRIEPIAAAAGRGDKSLEPVEIRNSPPSRLEIRPRGSGYELELDLVRESWVASSITAWSGWRVERNGEELPLGYANHAFLGFLAPAGRSRIIVRYWPRSFEVGLVLSATGIVASVALLWASRRRGVPRRG
jgi:hypothetical protein